MRFRHTDKMLLSSSSFRFSFSPQSSYFSDRHSEGRFHFQPNVKDIEAFQDCGVGSISAHSNTDYQTRAKYTDVATLSLIDATTSTSRSSLALFVILDLSAVVQHNH
jgi:hypothetical protein